MPNPNLTTEQTQFIMNRVKHTGIDALDVIPYTLSTDGLTATPVSTSAPQPVKVINTDGTDNSLTTGGIYGQKVHVVGDSDKYVRGNVAEGEAVSDPVYIGVRDASGNALGVRSGQQLEASSIPVVLPAAQITTLTPPAAITGFATSAKQDTLIAKENLDGTSTHGTRDLTSANTWYAVPSTVPTAAYILIAQPRTGNAGTIRWSFLNSGTPGAGTGLEIQGNLILRLAANESVVFASSTAGDDVDWTCKEIV